MTSDEIDTRLMVLDQMLQARDYLGARVAFFGLLYGLSLASGRDNGKVWGCCQWIAPVQQRVLPLYRLLVGELRRELGAHQRRANVETADGSKTLALREVMTRQQEIIAGALWADDPDDELVSVRELGRTVRDPKALACIEQARHLLEGHLRAIDRIDLEELEQHRIEREQEEDQLRRQAATAESLRIHAEALGQRLFAAEAQSLQAEAEVDRLASSLTGTEARLEDSRLEQTRLSQEVRREQEERRRHEQRLAELERQVLERKQRHRQEIDWERQQAAQSAEQSRQDQDRARAEREVLELQLADRERALTQLKQQVSLQDQSRQERFDLILALARAEETRLGQGSIVPAHEEYGCLIAWLWEGVAQETGLSFHDFAVFEEHLRHLLDQPTELDALLGHREAMIAFNEFQTGRIDSIDDLVAAAGYERGVDRDRLILDFAEHWPDWRREHRRRLEELFLRFRSGSLPAQTSLEKWFQMRGINPSVMTSESFAQLMNAYPEVFHPILSSKEGRSPPGLPPSQTVENPFGL